MHQRVDKLEALRGLAAIYVVIHHTVTHWYYVGGFNLGNLNRFGQEAVILFFLISGFVIKFAFEKARDKSFRTYFLKRFYRIYIPLLIVLFIGYFLMSYNAGHWIDPQLVVLVGNLAMLQDYGDVKPNIIVPTWLLNDPLWSLSYEWWFYMLFYPLTMFIRNTRLRDTLVFGSAVAASLAYLALPYFPVRIFMYIGIWWSGVYLAQAYMDRRLDNPTVLLAPALTLGVISLVMLWNVILVLPEVGPQSPGFHPWLELRHFVFALGAIVLGWGWRRLGWPLFRQLISPFAVLAPISYTIYISHYFLFSEATYLAFIGNWYVEWVCYLIVTLVVSWLIERLIYRALMQRLMPRRRQSVSAERGVPARQIG